MLVAPAASPVRSAGTLSGQLAGELSNAQRGVSTFRVVPGEVPSRRDLQRQSNVCMAVVAEARVAGLPAANVMVADSELPKLAGVKRSLSWLLGRAGGEWRRAAGPPQPRPSWLHKTSTLSTRSELLQMIEQACPQATHQHLAWPAVTVLICRALNGCNRQLLAAGQPMIAGAPANQVPLALLGFSTTHQQLVSGWLLQLMTLPDAFCNHQPPALQLPTQAPPSTTSPGAGHPAADARVTGGAATGASGSAT